MVILWDKLSENLQEWFYTLIGLLILIIGLGWIYTSPADFVLLVIIFGPITGYFLSFKGKFKLLGRPLVQRCSHCHTPMFAKYKGTFYCSKHLEEKMNQIHEEKGKLGRTEKRILKKIQAGKEERATEKSMN
jgi:uncharacterized membrane protein YqgA involved in biofilm formation